MSSLKIAVVPVTPLQQNCTLVTDAETLETAVIDPGGEAERILETLNARGLKAVAIWLTHGHLDHAGGAMALKEMLESRPGAARVEMIGPDRRDAFLLEGIEAQAASYGLSGLRNATPDRYLTEGETVRIGAHMFEVLHCPGHTPGHVVFINRAARFAQLGDVLFRGSIGRTDFPYGNHGELIDAIKTKILPLGDDIRFVCGHGPTSSIGAERAGNPFLT
jgi:glyoxylase-like metal-dependent hydrolase (beta-lactamase superfamily II)